MLLNKYFRNIKSVFTVYKVNFLVWILMAAGMYNSMISLVHYHWFDFYWFKLSGENPNPKHNLSSLQLCPESQFGARRRRKRTLQRHLFALPRILNCTLHLYIYGIQRLAVASLCDFRLLLFPQIIDSSSCLLWPAQINVFLICRSLFLLLSTFNVYLRKLHLFIAPTTVSWESGR